MPITAVLFLGGTSLPQFSSKFHTVVSFQGQFSVMEETRLFRTANGRDCSSSENGPQTEPAA